MANVLPGPGTPTTSSSLGDAMGEEVQRWVIVLLGAAGLAVLIDIEPEWGGWILLIVVLGMLLTATHKGLI